MDSHQQQTLLANLEALSAVQPQLEARIRLPMDLNHLALDSKLHPIYFHHTSWLNFETPYHQVVHETQTAGSSVSLFGVGFGEYINHLLQAFPQTSIIAWERDPALLRFLLMHHDFRESLFSGRLVFMLGVDLFAQRELFSASCTYFHPFFSQIYHIEKFALSLHHYSQTAVAGLGGLFVDDAVEELQRRNFLVWPVDLARWSLEEIDFTIETLSPSFLFAINYLNGTAEYCESKKLPFICWEIDPNMDASVSVKPPSTYSHIFTYRQKNVQLYEEGGFSQVHHLPLAANPSKRSPSRRTGSIKDIHIPVSFIGMSMVNEADRYRDVFIRLHRQYCDPDEPQSAIEARLSQILDEQKNSWSTYIIPQLFASSFPEFHNILRNHTISPDPVKIIGQIAAAQRRLHYVSQLGRYGIKVWGDAGWQSIEQHGATFMGYAGHNRDVTAIYSTSHINIDIGRLYQTDIVTMRVFDVLACGGFLIAEYSDELNHLFSIGEEVESYTTLEELQDKVSYYLDNRDSARAIAAAGMRAVRHNHTFHHRFTEIFRIVSQPDAG